MTLDAWNYAPLDTPADQLAAKDYLEHKDTGKETFSPGNSQAHRVFITLWDSRQDFIADILGYSFLDFSNDISRELPDVHPEIDTFYAFDAQVDPFGELDKQKAVPAAKWTCAKITVSYKPVDFALKDDNQI